MTVVSDTWPSPTSVLIGHVEVLPRLLGAVTIAEEVARELRDPKATPHLGGGSCSCNLGPGLQQPRGQVVIGHLGRAEFAEESDDAAGDLGDMGAAAETLLEALERPWRPGLPGLSGAPGKR